MSEREGVAEIAAVETHDGDEWVSGPGVRFRHHLGDALVDATCPSCGFASVGLLSHSPGCRHFDWGRFEYVQATDGSLPRCMWSLNKRGEYVIAGRIEPQAPVD